jgi:nicotinamide-nucleotide amidase
MNRPAGSLTTTVELINTGTELLLGRTLNTHQQWLCRQLSDHGYTVKRQVAVPDTGEDIHAAVREALTRADLVITTGGLGPTSDDVTRERVAELLGVTLGPHTTVERRLEAFYRLRNRRMPPRAALQTLVPEGATVLFNDHGTAPGLVMSVPAGRFRPNGSWLAMLPGPARELRPMFNTQLLPLIQQHCPPPTSLLCRTLRTTGLPESEVEARIAPHLEPLLRSGLELGYCARPGEVDIRLAAHGSEAAQQVEAAHKLVSDELGEFIFGEGAAELEEVVIGLLRDHRETLAVAESCTGGHLADRLTRVPGASEVFLGGWIPYSNALKHAALGVPAECLAAHGAVSEPVARSMAEGARRIAQASFALAITGIAGPGGGTPDKPVGTVFIALSQANSTVVLNPRNAWDRATFKAVTSQQALELLRRALLRKPNPASSP